MRIIGCKDREEVYLRRIEFGFFGEELLRVWKNILHPSAGREIRY